MTNTDWETRLETLEKRMDVLIELQKALARDYSYVCPRCSSDVATNDDYTTMKCGAEFATKKECDWSKNIRDHSSCERLKMVPRS